MKNRLICIMLLITLLFSVVQITHAANFDDRNANEITVYVDEKKMNFDVPPMLINNRTMVPMRAIFEALGATVSWDQTSQTAIGITNSITVKITIGENYLLKNGTRIELDSPAVIVSGRTLVPVRAIAESLDCDVNWMGEIKVVDIVSKVDDNSIETYVGEWELIGFISDFEKKSYVDDSFGQLDFRSNGTVSFSTYEGESSTLNYEVNESNNIIVRDNDYVLIGNVSSSTGELLLKEYHIKRDSEDISWITQSNKTIKRETYTIDSIVYIEVGYGHILKRID